MSLATIKKGDTVIMCMFTGVQVAVKDVSAATKTTISVETWKGEIKFSRKTGKQISPEPKNPRFANYIIEDDGSFIPLAERRAANKAKREAEKRTGKKVKPKATTEDDEIRPAMPSRKVPKKAAKPAAKQATKAPEPEDDFEEYDEA